MSAGRFRILLRGLAGRGDLSEALDEVGVGQGETFVIAHPEAVGRNAAKAGHCVFCDERINVNTAYRRVEGWAKPRGAEGGTNALALREVHEDEWACEGCVDKQKRGIAPEQASLV